MERARDLCRLGMEHLDAFEAVLVPAYRRAVRAMNTAAVQALASPVIGGIAQVVDAQAHVVRLVPQVDQRQGAVRASTSETDPWAPDPAQLAALQADKAALDAAISTRVPQLSVRMSPQWFGEEIVTGRAVEPPPRVPHVLVQLAYEAGLVVQLLEEADAIASLVHPTDKVRGTSEQASDGARAEAVGRLERWRTRPINFLFLVKVLTHRGVWQSMQGVANAQCHTAAELQRRVTAQGRETGMTADVGELWDTDEAHRALSYTRTDWKITDDEASRVLDMLAKAEPRARGGLVKQLHRMGRLRALCEHLPWGVVKQLWESIPDAEASRLLEPYWDGQGGGKSLGRMLREQEHWYTDALDTVLNVATFGAKSKIDASYDAREAGLITDDAYWQGVTKAIGRAAFVAAATAASGGVASEFVAGASQGMRLATGAIGRTATMLAANTTAGGFGNVAGHLAGDIYDQAFDGKQGFDSLSAYSASFAEGAIFSGAAAAVGLSASRFLPAGMRTLAQEAATNHPQWTPMLEAARRVGVGVGTHIRTTVAEFVRWMESGAPPGFRLAYGPSGVVVPAYLASAPPTAKVWITVRPLQDLNARPMQMAGKRDDLVEIRSVDLESGSLFDSYGEEASYQDNPAEADAEGPHGERSDAASQMDPRLAAEQGVSALHKVRLGIARPPRHHLFPQSEIEFFQKRGFPGRDIDNYCINMDPLEHELIHGGNQPLARKFWSEREWSTSLMKTLRRREQTLERLLRRDEILRIMEEQRTEFMIDDHPVVRYTRRP